MRKLSEGVSWRLTTEPTRRSCTRLTVASSRQSGVYVHACFQADIYKAYLAKQPAAGGW